MSSNTPSYAVQVATLEGALSVLNLRKVRVWAAYAEDEVLLLTPETPSDSPEHMFMSERKATLEQLDQELTDAWAAHVEAERATITQNAKVVELMELANVAYEMALKTHNEYLEFCKTFFDAPPPQPAPKKAAPAPVTPPAAPNGQLDDIAKRIEKVGNTCNDQFRQLSDQIASAQLPPEHHQALTSLTGGELQGVLQALKGFSPDEIRSALQALTQVDAARLAASVDLLGNLPLTGLQTAAAMGARRQQFGKWWDDKKFSLKRNSPNGTPPQGGSTN